MDRRRALLTSSLAGIGWFLGEFAVETRASGRELARALHRLTGSPEVRAHTEHLLWDAGLRVLALYGVLGASLGFLLGIALRALLPAPWGREASLLRWLGVLVLALAGVHGALTLRLLLRWPSLYPDVSVDVRASWGEAIPLPAVDGILGGMAAAVLLGTAWRYGRRGIAGVAAAAAVAWGGRGGSPPSPPEGANQGPNVLIVGLDAVRPDHLASFGHGRDTAPWLEAWLRDSWTWTRCYTPLARTYPAWSSLLTGRDPHEHGVREDLPPPERYLPLGDDLVRHLRDRGWHTAFFTDDSRFSYMVPEGGWDEIHQPPPGARNLVLSSYPLVYRFLHFFAGIGWDSGFGLIRGNRAFAGRESAERAGRRLARSLVALGAHRRFLAAVHLSAPHSPRDTPWPYYNEMGMRGYRGENRFRYRSSGVPTRELEDGADGSAAELHDAVARQNLALYDAGIREVDDQLRVVFGALEEAGLLRDTLVLIWSDHGEAFAEPGMRYRYRGPNHGFHAWDEGQNRVLMSLRLPDGRGRGIRDDRLSRVLDAAPTVLDALGEPPLAAATGWSRLGAVTPGPPPPEPRWVYGETGLSKANYWSPGHVRYPFGRPSSAYDVDRATDRVFLRRDFYPEALVRVKDRWIQDRWWKLVAIPEEGGTRFELFRVDRDPTNREDVAHLHPERVAEMAAELHRIVARDPDAAGGGPRGGGTPGDPPPPR
ncbi:sulfatase-like hydrolase/transferase [Myxococcota bacterium]|nr:sulfatase-like hydrolase/transferase [Myxococcota bacterium]